MKVLLFYLVAIAALLFVEPIWVPAAVISVIVLARVLQLWINGTLPLVLKRARTGRLLAEKFAPKFEVENCKSITQQGYSFVNDCTFASESAITKLGIALELETGRRKRCVFIAWSVVQKIELFRIDVENQLCARVWLIDVSSVRGGNIVVPWLGEFNEVVPKQVGLQKG